MARPHPYNRLRAAIATMHGKERVLGPIMARCFDIRLERAEGVDTDALGTFTGEIARAGNMLEAARAKARLAIERSGAPIGIGSEGAFGPHPHVPIIASGLELLVLREARSDREIVAHRRTRTNFDSVVASPQTDLAPFLNRIGFPAHAVIVKPEACDDRFVVIKGIMETVTVKEAVASMAERSSTGRALVQTDMRAHVNPTRMTAIRVAAKALALRLARLCPRCDAPGFGLVELERGLPCRDCGRPTQLLRAEVHGCNDCGHRQKKRERHETARADPIWCDACNP